MSKLSYKAPIIELSCPRPSEGSGCYGKESIKLFISSNGISHSFIHFNVHSTLRQLFF